MATLNSTARIRDAIIIGGGCAGLSAAIYLGRARRDTLIVDSGQSLARWEPNVQNYLGFPNGLSGNDLLERGCAQAAQFGVECLDDLITAAQLEDIFRLEGKSGVYFAKRLLLATGLFHVPPDIPGVEECLGRSLFFCKDCDAYRVQDQRIAIFGRNNEAIEYALAMLPHSANIIVATNGCPPVWDDTHAAWLEEYEIPVCLSRVTRTEHDNGQMCSLAFDSGECLAVDCVFTTRGDVYHNHLAKNLGAEIDSEGQIIVDAHMRTSLPGLYAAGCVTPANCQMVIAAGQGAAAAQAINRDLFKESLRTHSLRRFREHQLHPGRLGQTIL